MERQTKKCILCLPFSEGKVPIFLQNVAIKPIFAVPQIMKHLLTPLLLLFLLIPLKAEADDPLDSLWLDTRVSFHQETKDGVYAGQFLGEHFNIHVMGHVSPTVSYRIRHRLNKKVNDGNNMFNATDMLYLKWTPSDKWNLLAGKYAVLIGNYEFDAAPIDVYYYSKFCDNINQGFTFGVLYTWNLSDRQSVMVQVCDSPLSFGKSSTFAYNAGWRGEMASWWKTMWTVDFVDDCRDIPVIYVALGNKFFFGPAMLDVDVMNRSGLSQKNLLLSDMTIISKFIWSLKRWNLCAKAGYEFNDSENIDSEGRPYDLVISPGTKYFYTGCGLEWFPPGTENIRLHAVYYRDNDIRQNNLELGLTWKMNIYKKGGIR